MHPGDALALIGPNGAGKSTLLSILAGALEPSDGSVAAASGRSPRPEGRLGAAEAGALPASLPAREPRALRPARGRAPSAPEVAERYIGLLDLPDDGRLTAELSAGNQQRLNLAVALLAAPDVLLLDEPTASLDPRQRRLLWEVAAEVRERGGAVVFATQNLEELERFADPGRRSGRRRARLRRQPRAVQSVARGGRLRVRKVRLLLKKDLRILGRSPVLVAALVVYPLVFAALVGARRPLRGRPAHASPSSTSTTCPSELTVGGQTLQRARRSSTR